MDLVVGNMGMYKKILNWDYDPKRDIAFIFSQDYDYQESIKLMNLSLDLNPQGKVVALEIFNSSRSLEVEKESLTTPEDFLIEISVKNRTFNVIASFKLHSEGGLTDRWLREKTVVEHRILENILRPIHHIKEK